MKAMNSPLPVCDCCWCRSTALSSLACSERAAGADGRSTSTRTAVPTMSTEASFRRPLNTPGKLCGNFYFFMTRMLQQLSAQRFEQLGKDLRRRCAHVAGLQVTRFAAEIAHQPARFLNQERSGRHVPRREPHLPERVQSPAGDIGQVESRGAGTPYTRAALEEVSELPGVEIEARQLLERKSGADQRFLQARAFRDADAAVVEERATAFGGGEQLVLHRVVDHAVRERAAMLHRDRHAVLREA